MGTVEGVLAHGIGGRQDLPIPFTWALTGAVVALLATFLVLAWAWPASRFRGAEAGRPLPAGLARVLDAPAFRWALRAFGLCAGGWVVLVLVAGPDATADNAAPGVLYVLMWVVVPLGSVLLGPIWRVISPLRTLHLLLARATGGDPDRGMLTLPARWGYWPAAVTLLVFVWLELVPADRATVPVVFFAFVTYGVVMLVGAGLFGSGWFARADPFEVYSSLAARLAPVGRRGDGRLVLRNPLDGLDSLPATPGLAGVVLVLLGSTAYDSLSNAPWWLRLVQESASPTLVATAGLVGAIAVLAVAYPVTMLATRWLVVRRSATSASADPQAPGWELAGPPSGLGGKFAHSLLPIALGYMLAHYYSLAVLEGQRTLILAADPLGTGNLLGWSTIYIYEQPVTATGVSTLQVVAVLVGHIAGAVAAHDRAVRLFTAGPPGWDERAVATAPVAALTGQVARVAQLPLLALMVGYTYLGLTLLFAA